MRAQQLLRRDLDLEEATARVERMRVQGKEYQDEAMSAENRKYKVRDLVLLHNSRWKEDNSASRKLGFWWLGPYRVASTNHRKGNYTLEELDGSEMTGTVPGNRLKSYFSRPNNMVDPQPLQNSASSSVSESEDDFQDHVPIPLTSRKHVDPAESDDFVPDGSDSDV